MQVTATILFFAAHVFFDATLTYFSDVSPALDFGTGPSILIVTGRQRGKGKNYSQVVNLSSPNQCNGLSPYPAKVQGAAGGVVNGRPIVCGGEPYIQYSYSTYISSCYIHNKLKDTWEFLTDLSGEKGDMAATPLNGSLWITGGTIFSESSLRYSPYASTEYIHPDGSKVSGPDLPEPRYAHCAATLDDERVIIMGGKVNGEYQDSKKVIIYDPKTKTFQTSFDMIYRRSFFGCALMRSPMHGNRYVILAVGGDGEFNFKNGAYNEKNPAEIFDYTNPDSNGWEEVTKLPNTDDGIRAMTSFGGFGAYVHSEQNLFEFNCDASSCSWKKLPQELKEAVSESVMMKLPTGYTSCKN